MRQTTNGLLINVDEIEPSPRQHRAHPIGYGDVAELAESIRQLGQLQPALVRSLGGGRWELVAGERRWRACRLVGVDLWAVPVESDDAHLATATAAENLERKGISAIEESRAVVEAAAAEPHVGKLAELFGRSERWIQRHLALYRGISETWQRAATDPESPVSRWSGEALEAVALLPPDRQEDLWTEIVRFQVPRYPTASYMRGLVDRMLHRLEGATWDLEEDDVAGEPACSSCPKRGGSQGALWDAWEVAGDVCLDTDCWTRKSRSIVERRRAEVRSSHGREPVLVSMHDSREDSVDAVPAAAVRAAREGDDGAVPCILVDGPRSGEVTWGRVPGHGPEPAPEVESAVKGLRRRARDMRRVLRDAQPPAGHLVIALAAAFGTHYRLGEVGNEWPTDSILPRGCRAIAEATSAHRAPPAPPWIRTEIMAANRDLAIEELWRGVRVVLRERIHPSTDPVRLARELAQVEKLWEASR